MIAILQLSSTRTAAVDLLRRDDASSLAQVAGVVGFALLTAVGAQFRVYLWEVPFTLQTLAVYGSGLFLGWRNGALSQVLYLALGLFFPVYAGSGHGLAYLIGAASAGYLFGFPVASAIAGYMSKRWNSLTGSVLSMVAGSLCFFTLGVVWLHVAAGHETWLESIDKGWLRFIPADLAKILLVGMLYSGSRSLTRRPQA